MTKNKIKTSKKLLIFTIFIATVLVFTFGISSQFASSTGCSCPYKKTELHGGGGGNYFSDDLTMTVRITKITIRHGTYVDAIQTSWLLSNGTEVIGENHGGSGGTPTDIQLDNDEYIVRVDGSSGTYVDRIKFYTNKGREFGPYGGSGGNPFSISGLCVGGFCGRSGSYVDSIGIITSSPK